MSLGDRLEQLGQKLAERETQHAASLAHARAFAEKLRGEVEDGLARYHTALGSAAHLGLELSPVRTDDKYAHSLQFDIVRGRIAGIVTVKGRGEVTLVGPFRRGKTEGPCRSFPIPEEGDAACPELETALESFLVELVEEATRP